MPRLQPAGGPTIGSHWCALVGSPPTDDLLEWPPDVLAFTEVVLEHAEAYRFAVSPPGGHTWPPEDQPDWADAVVAAGQAWAAWAEEWDGPVPAMVAAAWATVVAGVDTAVEDVAEAEDGAWPLCAALLTLHAAADEACAGLGVACDAPAGPGVRHRARARELLARTGSLARIDPHRLRVLPKVRTPPGGISLRSLSRYACVRGPEVDVTWHKAPIRRPDSAGSANHAQVLLLPWPLRLRQTDFRPVPGSVQRADQLPYGFFEYAPSEPLDLDLVGDLLVAARDEVDAVDVVALPESAVHETDIPALEAVLATHGVTVLVAGVRGGGGGGEPPCNQVHVGVRLGGRWWHYRQLKHHRWSLDDSQVHQYHLGGSLHPGVRWWEATTVPRRAVQVVELRTGVAFVTLICEDLARLDAVADLVRSIGPSLVVTPLLDGPQLASRWTARYATVLADDPGSAVLTLSSFGMVDRSRPAGFPPSRVVALWKDPRRGLLEIALEPGSQGVLVTVCTGRATRHSADGRRPAADATELFAVDVHQVQRTAAGAAPSPHVPDPATAGSVVEPVDLTVVMGWAEALAEAGSWSPDAVPAVVEDARVGAAWRREVGLDDPPAVLAAALDALIDVSAAHGGNTPDHALARRLVRNATEDRAAR